MISIEQWRARIGLFNCKCVRTATPSPVILSPYFSFLILISSRQEHFSSTPTATDERPTRTSSTGQAASKQPRDRTHAYEVACACSLRTSQAAADSTLSSYSGSGLFSLRRSVFKSVLMILVIAVISQLLVISGDVETNPGPKHRGEQAPPVHWCACIT